MNKKEENFKIFEVVIELQKYINQSEENLLSPEKEKELKDKVDYKSKNAFRYYEKHPDARKVDFEEI